MPGFKYQYSSILYNELWVISFSSKIILTVTSYVLPFLYETLGRNFSNVYNTSELGRKVAEMGSTLRSLKSKQDHLISVSALYKGAVRETNRDGACGLSVRWWLSVPTGQETPSLLRHKAWRKENVTFSPKTWSSSSCSGPWTYWDPGPSRETRSFLREVLAGCMRILQMLFF